MLTEPTNTRRATPERVLWLFAIFTVLAALSAVRDCRHRPLLESAVPSPAAAPR